MSIDSSAVHGEPGTGFEKRGDKGPFECGNCEHFHAGRCDQKDMMARSKQPKDKDGYVLVGAQDCCEYVDRLGGHKKRLLAAIRARK